MPVYINRNRVFKKWSCIKIHKIAGSIQELNTKEVWEEPRVKDRRFLIKRVKLSNQRPSRPWTTLRHRKKLQIFNHFTSRTNNTLPITYITHEDSKPNHLFPNNSLTHTLNPSIPKDEIWTLIAKAFKNGKYFFSKHCSKAVKTDKVQSAGKTIHLIGI